MPDDAGAGAATVGVEAAGAQVTLGAHCGVEHVVRIGPSVEQLKRRVSELEQHAAELRGLLADRDDELDAARATNRELMTQLNRPTPTHTDGRHH